MAWKWKADGGTLAILHRKGVEKAWERRGLASNKVYWAVKLSSTVLSTQSTPWRLAVLWDFVLSIPLWSFTLWPDESQDYCWYNERSDEKTRKWQAGQKRLKSLFILCATYILQKESFTVFAESVRRSRSKRCSQWKGKGYASWCEIRKIWDHLSVNFWIWQPKNKR